MKSRTSYDSEQERVTMKEKINSDIKCTMHYTANEPFIELCSLIIFTTATCTIILLIIAYVECLIPTGSDPRLVMQAVNESLKFVKEPMSMQ